MGKRLLASINFLRTFPVFLCVLCSKQKHLVEMDVVRWNEITGMKLNMFESINWYMNYRKEFRNLLQHRLKNPSRSLNVKNKMPKRLSVKIQIAFFDALLMLLKFFYTVKQKRRLYSCSKCTF